VHGTVPYLGTFLTDLMMVDSALKDTAEDDVQLINFDKRLKEFELLTQIRLLQAAAALYHIEPDDDFWQKFCSIPVNSDNERFSSFDCNIIAFAFVCYSHVLKCTKWALGAVEYSQ